MKKIIKNPIFTFIMGLLIAGGIGVVYAYVAAANEVSYTPSNSSWNVSDVKSALDDLYSKTEYLYLYSYGSTYDSVTGGWGSTMTIPKAFNNQYTITKKNPTFNSDHMYLTLDNTFQYSVVNTKNKIDFSGYKYINIVYRLEDDYSTCFRFSSSLSESDYTSASTIHLYNFTDSAKFVKAPININAQEYLSISILRGAASDPISKLKIYQIYLSRV